MIADERFVAICIGVHASKDLGADVAVMNDLKGASFDVGDPLGDVFGETEVGIEEVPAGSEDTGDFVQKGGEIGVAVGGFDIENRVER